MAKVVPLPTDSHGLKFADGTRIEKRHGKGSVVVPDAYVPAAMGRLQLDLSGSSGFVRAPGRDCPECARGLFAWQDTCRCGAVVQ